MVYRLIGQRTLPLDYMLWKMEFFSWACVCCFVRPQWFYHSPISRSECNAWLPVTQFRRRVQARTEHEEDIITTLTTLFMLQLGVQRAGPAALHRERQGGLRQVQPPVQQRSREGDLRANMITWTISPRKYNSAMQNPRQVAPPRQVPHPRAVRAAPRPPLRPLSALPAPYRPLPILLATSPPALYTLSPLYTLQRTYTPYIFILLDTLTLDIDLSPLTRELDSLSFECVVFSFLFCLGYGRLVSHCALSPYWIVSTPSSVASAQTSVGTLPPINSHKR